jgi:hypothetical protein
MTKRTRTTLFLIFLVLFLLIAPSVIFYSQGYRFDFENEKITQTGGLFFKIEPKQAEIYIDGKLIKKTDFLFGSAFIDNLLPKKHKIEIKKEGYFPWEKNLEIRERWVTEAKNIVLIPEKTNFSVLTENVENFWFSPDGKKVVLFEKGGAEETSWSLKLYDLEKNNKSHLMGEEDFILFFPFTSINGSSGSGKDISSKKANLLDLRFSEDSKEISLEIELKDGTKYFSLKIGEVPPTLVEVEAPSPPFKNTVTYQKINNDIYYLDNSGNFFKVDELRSSSPSLRSVNEEKLTEEPFPIKPETEYILEIFQNFIFLKEGQSLYLFNSDSRSFEKFFDSVKNFKISSDEKKMVYFSDCEIWILFLKDKLDQPAKKTGEKFFLTRVSEKINDVFWLNSDYLIFDSGNKLKIAEIDDRDKINIYDLGESKEPPQGAASAAPTGQAKIFFNKSDKKLYVLTEGNLYASSDKIIP